MEQNKVLAMYDVRRIQQYVFRTPKIKDAVGASAIVENIIMDALKYAVKEMGIASEEMNLKWCNETGVEPYRPAGSYKIEVLYIGGGNAYLIFEDRKLCVDINKIMSRFVIEKTYSLQLAVAITEATENYGEDQRRLRDRMEKTKANMPMSKPLGALPIMEIEGKTGYPAVETETGDKLSRESQLKKQTSEGVRSGIKKQMRILDNYITKKGVDSTLAIVHIDGNNMGQRIQNLIAGIEDYEEAVNKMREISYNINASYKQAYEKMQEFFNSMAAELPQYEEKETDQFVMKILAAGDDITYICNGNIALATVEFYCREISRCTMNGKNDSESIRDYGFSVCAGIAYIHSHFPFSIGYEVAEACCGNAKKRAKCPDNMDQGRIGNWVDFQICKNIQAQDLNQMREREYKTRYGEQLLLRPYYIRADEDRMAISPEVTFESFKDNLTYFRNEEKLPRTFAKKLRNFYPQGENQVNRLMSFLESRQWKLPKAGPYFENENVKTASWYDALEMMDYYIGLDEVTGVNK